jgi:hypothetical protein
MLFFEKCFFVSIFDIEKVNEIMEISSPATYIRFAIIAVLINKLFTTLPAFNKFSLMLINAFFYLVLDFAESFKVVTNTSYLGLL